jgi:two-component system sensor histidine kinase UhpB
LIPLRKMTSTPLHPASPASPEHISTGADVARAKEEERHRIAREIHDDLGGDLVGLKMALAQLIRRLPGDDPILTEHAAYVTTLVERSINTAQRIAHNQRCDVADFGLVAAFARQCKQFERQFEIACQFSANLPDPLPNPDQGTALFRICQEALTNIGKHAHANLVIVHLKQTKHCIILKISDNGCGITSADRQKPESLGIKHMQERAQILGGNLSIRAASIKGSVLTAELPLD